MKPFILSCESTVDLPYTVLEDRDIHVLHYSYTVNDTEYDDDMGRDPGASERYYQMLETGVIPHTSQINAAQYLSYFNSLPEEGDILHVTFSTGMSGSYQGACMAAKEWCKEHKDRRLIVMDGLCASGGYGMLMLEADDMRREGCSLEETEQKLLRLRVRIHQLFYCTDLTFFKHSGRISTPGAMLGSLLNICPVMCVNAEGRIILVNRVRGIKHAMRKIADDMLLHAENGEAYQKRCIISHAHCPDSAAALQRAVESRFSFLKDKIVITDIGPVITSHCGPGTCALFFIGDERTN